MKKHTATLFMMITALVMLLTLAHCGDRTTDPGDGGDNNTNSGTTTNTGNTNNNGGTTNTGTGTLVINEFVAKGSEDTPPDGSDTEDWLELFNATTNGELVIPANTYAVTDTDDDTSVYLMLPATNISGGGFLVIWCDDTMNAVTGEPLHAPFKLSGSGDTIYLLKTNAIDGGFTEIDSYEYTSAESGEAHGRVPDGGTWQTGLTPTPGAANN